MITDKEQIKQANVARQTEKAATRALRFDGGTRALRGYANPDRRTAFRIFFGSWLALGGVSLGVPDPAHAAALSKEQRDQLTADQIIDLLKAGNERFCAGKMQLTTIWRKSARVRVVSTRPPQSSAASTRAPRQKSSWTPESVIRSTPVSPATSLTICRWV